MLIRLFGLKRTLQIGAVVVGLVVLRSWLGGCPRTL